MQRTTTTAYLIWLGLLAACLIYLASSLRVVSDITQFMPDNHGDKNVQLLLNELQHGNTARLLILGIKGSNPKKLASLSRLLKAKLDKNDSFGLVHNGQQALSAKDFITGKYKTLYKYRYLLYPNTSFSKEALSLSLQQRFSELRSGLNIFKQTLSSDPQNHFTNYLWKLSERGETTHHLGVWFNKDKTAALLLIELNLKNFDIDEQQHAINEIHQSINLLSELQAINLKVDILVLQVWRLKHVTRYNQHQNSCLVLRLF